jgi:PPOX class probable F420-dependent enzyme
LLDRARGYLGKARCAVLSTLGSDGAPHQSVVHYLVESDHLMINARTDRIWARNLQRDPRVSVVVHDAGDSQHWVGLKGVAEVAAVGAAAVTDAVALAQRYGEDPAPFRIQERISFRIVPGRVYEYGVAEP